MCISNCRQPHVCIIAWTCRQFVFKISWTHEKSVYSFRTKPVMGIFGTVLNLHDTVQFLMSACVISCYIAFHKQNDRKGSKSSVKKNRKSPVYHESHVCISCETCNCIWHVLLSKLVPKAKLLEQFNCTSFPALLCKGNQRSYSCEAFLLEPSNLQMHFVKTSRWEDKIEQKIYKQNWWLSGI